LKMSFMIEVVVYLGVITGKFLEHCTTPKVAAQISPANLI
jgi:hypothetical protein